MNAKLSARVLGAAEQAAASVRPNLPMVELIQLGDQAASETASELFDRAEISGGQSLIKLSRSEAMLAELRGEHAMVRYELIATDPAVEDSARKFRMKCSAFRTHLKDTCLDLRRPARDFATKVIAAEGVINEQILAIEAVGDKILTQIDADKKAERERKAVEAAAAAQLIDDAIAAIRSRPNLLAGKPAAEIEHAIAIVEAIDITEEGFGKKGGDAFMFKMATLDTLRTMHTNAVQWEQQQRELAAGQAKLAAARAAQDAIDEIAGFGMRAMGQPAAVIADLVTELEAVDVMHDVFAGRAVEALEVRHRVLAVLSQLHDAAEASEQRAAELKVQQDQLDAQRKDQAARQALLDKAEQEAKDKREAEEQARCERAEAIEVRIAAFGSLAADSAACSSIVLRDRLLMIERSAFTADLYGDRVAEARSAAEDTAKELSELLEAALLREQEAATAERQAQEALERETRAAALAAKVREVSGAMHNVLRQWKHAEVAKDKVELANAKVNRDALLAQLEG